MKSLIISIITSLFFIVSLTAQEKADKDYFTIQVDGLGCPFCAYGLEKKFKEFKSIKDVRIDMETGIFTFNYPAEEALNEEIVERQVELAGYTPMWLEIKRADGTIFKKVNEQEDKGKNVVANASAEMKVYGKCNMCKKRIEKAAKSQGGVAEAEWNQKKQVLKIKYDDKVITPDLIEKNIVNIGHDTENFKAADDVYKSLPACCKYKRKKA